MTTQNCEFVNHQQEVQSFVIESVGLIMQMLNEQIGHQVQCIYSYERVRESLQHLLEPFAAKYLIKPRKIATEFTQVLLPKIVEASQQDAERYPTQDPALESLEEVFYASNGFWGTVAYRIANALYNMNVPVVPRAISGIAHSRTGIDIHPGASIAPGLFIDHGTGIAIGCTAVIEENVNLYNGVVLGTRSKPRKKTDEVSGKTQKRHPTICRNVSLYTNAFVGGDIVVGEGATIGAYAFVCSDVRPGKLVPGKKEDPMESHIAIPTKQFTATNDPQPRPAADEPYRSVLSMIGNTPMIEIRNFDHNPEVKIFAKLEGSNPSGSVKDRIALSLVEEGEKSGELTKDKIILESTSGNTGIGLAMVGAAKGYEVVLTMSAAMSEERKQVLKAFGAKLIETDPDKGTGGAIAKAREMVAENPGKYWVANQHASLDNPKTHYENMAIEILEAVPDVTHFVAGIGTFGTLRGAGQRLREEAGAEVVGLEPELGKPIQGLRNMQEPNSPQLYDESFLDTKLTVLPEDAFQRTRELALREGLFVGMSSGAALHGALEIANSIDSGVVVVVFPDRGEKYLSTPLFDVQEQESAPSEADDDDSPFGWETISSDKLSLESIFAYTI